MHCVGGVLTHVRPAQRIVSVASVAHEGSKGIDFVDIAQTTHFNLKLSGNKFTARMLLLLLVNNMLAVNFIAEKFLNRKSFAAHCLGGVRGARELEGHRLR